MPDSPPTPLASPTDEALAAWRRKLSAMGGADPLTRYEDLPEGTLDLASAHPSGLAMFLAGRPTRLSSLFREQRALSDARRRARAIRLAASGLEDEHGLTTGHLAVGMVSWTADRQVVAPVLLRPITLRPRGAGHVDYDLDLGSEVSANPALLRLLRQAGLAVEPAELESLAVRSQRFDPAPAFARLRQVAGSLPGFTLRSRLVLGTFADLAPALVAELDRLAPAAAESDVVAALAGDPEARTRLAAAGRDTSRPVPETDDVQVLPLDAGQRAVVAAVAEGRSVRVEAPAGTGATQVLAGVLAAAAATGRRSLLVTAQRSEIRDVTERLDSAGLAGLVAPAADGGPRCEAAAPHAEPDDAGQRQTHRTAEAADRVVRHHRGLHTVRQPWGASALTAVHRLVALTSADPVPLTAVRLSPEALRRLDEASRDRAAAALREAAELGEFDPGARDAPWYGARLASHQEAEEVLATVSSLSGELLPALRSDAQRLADDAGLSPARSVAEWGRQIDLLIGVRTTLDVFTPAVYERPVTDMVTATASSSWRAERGLAMGLFERRRWERSARELVRPGCSVPDLHSGLLAAQAQREQWQAMSTGGGWPRVPAGLAAADAGCARVVAALQRLERALAGTPEGGRLAEAPLPDLERRLTRLAADPQTLDVVPRRAAALAVLRDLGLDELAEDLRTRTCRPEQVPAELELAWWRSLLEHLLEEDRDLAAAGPASLDEALAALRRGRRARRRGVARRLSEGLASGQVPSCRATSPLALPHEVPPDAPVDVVVLAGAHRVGAAEGVLALARARQVVVVGDPAGLPPATVSLRGDDADGVAAGAAPEVDGVRAGVLDLLDGALPTLRLSRQHRMPAQLCVLADAVTGQRPAQQRVPAPDDAVEVVLDVVPEGVAHEVAARSAAVVDPVDAEVRRVVALVLEHARRRPEESLAVVALGRSHARRVADALRADLPEHPDVARWLTAGRPEPFLVTDADRAEDAVRDAVLLTVGLGRTANSRSPHGFGRLDAAGGERRLTVALTRARRRLTVVSGIVRSDLDGEPLTTPGAQALRSLLAALERGEATAPLEGLPLDDPLLADLVRRLVARGRRPRPGPPGGLDLTVPGTTTGSGAGSAEPVAVLTDLRPAEDEAVLERELQLPGHLARFGWRVVRVGAVWLFTDPDAQVRRVLGVSP